MFNDRLDNQAALLWLTISLTCKWLWAKFCIVTKKSLGLWIFINWSARSLVTRISGSVWFRTLPSFKKNNNKKIVHYCYHVILITGSAKLVTSTEVRCVWTLTHEWNYIIFSDWFGNWLHFKICIAGNSSVPSIS